MTPDLIERLERADGAVYDKTGRQIRVGDVLKVYHFRGARWNKDYFMFKQVVCEKPVGKSGKLYLLVSHLNMKPADAHDGGYYLAQDGDIKEDTEIVQGLDWHHDRPRIAALRAREVDRG